MIAFDSDVVGHSHGSEVVQNDKLLDDNDSRGYNAHAQHNQLLELNIGEDDHHRSPLHSEIPNNGVMGLKKSEINSLDNAKEKQRDTDASIAAEVKLFKKPGDSEKGYMLYTEQVMERLRSEPRLSNHLLSQFSGDRDVQWAFTSEKLQLPESSKQLRILCVTWNMHGKMPRVFTEKLLRAKTTQHHLVAISTQECIRSIPASFFCESKARWEAHLLSELGKEYTLVRGVSMNALHIAIFAHSSIEKYVTAISTDVKATGIGNVVGNKGGIGMSLEIGKHSFLFINSHFASGQHCNLKRNEDFKQISNSLSLPKYYDSPKDPLAKRFHYVFWMGDFNYRIEAQRRSDVDRLLNDNAFFELLKRDQLSGQRRVGYVFSEFQEGLILFPPTYKMKAEQNEYAQGTDSRIPGWTDRIFFKQKLPNSLVLRNYEMALDVLGSDHRPVFAQFEANVQIDPSFQPVQVKAKGQCNIF